jgi:hypothetical protein
LHLDLAGAVAHGVDRKRYATAFVALAGSTL